MPLGTGLIRPVLAHRWPRLRALAGTAHHALRSPRVRRWLISRAPHWLFAPQITVKYLKGLIALIDEHIPNLDNSEVRLALALTRLAFRCGLIAHLSALLAAIAKRQDPLPKHAVAHQDQAGGRQRHGQAVPEHRPERRDLGARPLGKLSDPSSPLRLRRKGSCALVFRYSGSVCGAASCSLLLFRWCLPLALRRCRCALNWRLPVASRLRRSQSIDDGWWCRS